MDTYRLRVIFGDTVIKEKDFSLKQVAVRAANRERESLARWWGQQDYRVEVITVKA